MDLIDLAPLTNGEGDFETFIDDLCQNLEFDYASYAAINPVTGLVQGYANYSPEWKLHYAKRGYHRIDPTLRLASKSIAPVDWARFERNDKFEAVFFSAHDFGITPRGLTVPVRGPYGDCGLLSVTRDCSQNEWQSLIRQQASALQLAAVHMHDAIMQSDILSRVLRRPQLSSREREILQWTAAGKSQSEIGDILTISHRTVEVHLRSAREKLGALTTAQTVGRAVGLGLVLPG
ncbi:autoinducer binding domain-containing protein [Palleronia sp.]|uniref:autoinducer binding domain-containing protein n=1 Tax=Palleronia sp. TaxID=1940284 RepID=UPI0035C79C51